MIERLVSKIVQINTKVREKLIELDILKDVESSLEDIPIFEETLNQYLNQSEFNIEVLMTFVAITSRLRLQKERQFRLKKSEHIFYEKIKKALQELIKSNRTEILHNFKEFIHPTSKLSTPIDPFDDQDFVILDAPSYPVTTYTCTHPNKLSSTDSPVNDHSNPSLGKSMNQIPVRPSSANPYYHHSRSGKKGHKSRHNKDMKQRKSHNMKVEDLGKNSVELYKGFVDSGIPNLATSLNKETLSIRDKIRSKKLKSLNLNERVSHTYDFNTQESEPNISDNQQVISTSYEKILKIESTNSKLNQNEPSLKTERDEVEFKDTQDTQAKNSEILLPLKLETIDNKNKNELSLDKRKKSPSPQKARDINLKILNSVPKTIIPSNESPILFNSEISSTSIKVLNILKTGKGFSREDMVNLITLNENKEAKEGKPIRSSYYESWKNYDVMNIEYRPLMVTKKLEAKMALMERVYNDLMYFNFEIKKSTGKFYTDFNASKVIEQPAFVEQIINEELLNSKVLPKKVTKLTAKITTKSRRSISIDNSQSRRVSRNPINKLGQDVRHSGENNLVFMRGSVPQVTNPNFQRTMFPKAATTKLAPKLFILPKLNVVDTSKQASEMTGNSLGPLPPQTNTNLKTINFATGLENRYSSYQPIQVTSSIESKKISYESNLNEQKDLSVSPSAQKVPKNKVIPSMKVEGFMDHFPEENYQSFFDSGNFNEPQNTDRKNHFRKNIINEALKAKFKGISSRYETNKELPEIKGRLNKLSIEFCKPYPDTPDNVTKNYPLKINLQR